MTQLAKNIGEKAKNLITLREKFLSLVPHFEVVEVSNLFLNWSDVNSKLNNLATKFLNEELNAEKYEVELNNLFNSLEIELVVLDPKHEGLPLVLSELKRFQFRVLTVSDENSILVD